MSSATGQSAHEKEFAKLTFTASDMPRIVDQPPLIFHLLTGYLGKSTAFEDTLAEFGVAYADQNERDYAALMEAIRSGRIEARTAE